MPRRPLRQLINEAKQAERTRRISRDGFDNWLSEGLGSAADQRTKDAKYEFDGETLTISYDFPTLDDLPPLTGRAEYVQLLAEMALRCVHHVLSQDQPGAIHEIIFDGYVDTIDLATGRDIRPSLIHFQTERRQFDQLQLARVDPLACLHGLNATISPRTQEMSTKY